MGKRGFRNLLSVLSCILALGVCGCEPNFKKETLVDSLEQMSTREYGIQIKAALQGNTLAVYLPVSGLFNDLYMPSQQAILELNKVSFCASRICFSSDTKIDFFIVICQDPKDPGLQLVTIRYVEDVKKGSFWMMSRADSYNRMIIDVQRTPQAQTQQVVNYFFEKTKLDPELAEKFFKEHFLSKPITSIDDIGFWDGAFYLKEITMGEFLAKQMKQRIQRHFLGEDFKKKYDLVGLQSMYVVPPAHPQGASFSVELDASPRNLGQKDFTADILKPALEIIADVVGGYHFNDFQTVVVMDTWSKKRIEATREDLYKLFNKQVDFSYFEIFGTYTP